MNTYLKRVVPGNFTVSLVMGNNDNPMLLYTYKYELDYDKSHCAQSQKGMSSRMKIQY